MAAMTPKDRVIDLYNNKATATSCCSPRHP
jgi:hypothetical protein